MLDCNFMETLSYCSMEIEEVNHGSNATVPSSAPAELKHDSTSIHYSTVYKIRMKFQ